jgi:hypothetical protein
MRARILCSQPSLFPNVTSPDAGPRRHANRLRQLAHTGSDVFRRRVRGILLHSARCCCCCCSVSTFAFVLVCSCLHVCNPLDIEKPHFKSSAPHPHPRHLHVTSLPSATPGATTAAVKSRSLLPMSVACVQTTPLSLCRHFQPFPPYPRPPFFYCPSLSSGTASHPPVFSFFLEIVSNSAQTSRSFPFRHARDAAFYPPSPTESNPSTFKTAERAPPLITLAAPPLVTLVPARLAAGAHGSSSNGSVADDAAALAASWLSQTWRTDGANALCIAPVLRIEAGGCEISSPLAFKLLFFTPHSCAGSSTAVLLSPTPMVAIKQQPIPAGVPPCERGHLQLSPRAAAPYEHF